MTLWPVKKFTSIEDMLSESGAGATSPDRAGTDAAPDNRKKQSFGSIEDVMATAEEESKKSKKNYKIFASTLRNTDGKVTRQPKLTTSDSDDYLDEFDCAIDAAEVARQAIPHDRNAAKIMAVNLLWKSLKTSRLDAENLIYQAFKYLER